MSKHVTVFVGLLVGVAVLAGCARVTGQPVAADPGGAVTGAVESESSCAEQTPAKSAPDGQSTPVLFVESLSVWNETFSDHRAYLVVYHDETVAKFSQQGMEVGGIGTCTLKRLQQAASGLVGADFGQPGIFDASTTTVTATGNAGWPRGTISAYALGMGDAAGSGNVTEAQQRLRAQFTTFLEELDRSAQTWKKAEPTVVRMMAFSTGLYSGAKLPKTPISWPLATPPSLTERHGPFTTTTCGVLTGTDAQLVLKAAAASKYPDAVTAGSFTVAGKRLDLLLVPLLAGDRTCTAEIYSRLPAESVTTTTATPPPPRAKPTGPPPPACPANPPAPAITAPDARSLPVLSIVSLESASRGDHQPRLEIFDNGTIRKITAEGTFVGGIPECRLAELRYRAAQIDDQVQLATPGPHLMVSSYGLAGWPEVLWVYDEDPASAGKTSTDQQRKQLEEIRAFVKDLGEAAAEWTKVG